MGISLAMYEQNVCQTAAGISRSGTRTKIGGKVSQHFRMLSSVTFFCFIWSCLQLNTSLSINKMSFHCRRMCNQLYHYLNTLKPSPTTLFFKHLCCLLEVIDKHNIENILSFKDFESEGVKTAFL